MQCPFCQKKLKISKHVKKCISCESNYSEINTSTSEENNVNIVHFDTKNFNVEIYDNNQSSVTKISDHKSQSWVNSKIKITDFNLKKIDDKIKKILLFK